MYAYTLVRSKRKTIAIHITSATAVEVRAPLLAPAPAIDAFVKSKDAWIAERLRERRERLDERAAFTLGYGDTLPLCGRMITVRAADAGKAGYGGDAFLIPPGMEPEHIRRAVVLLYKRAAKDILEAKTAHYAQKLGVFPASVKINSAKTRWGSCSGKNSVNFSWRLVMADEETIDYVVAHELAHIRQHNHSARFWAIVESVIPDYKQRKARLRELSDRLSREDWD